MSNPIQDSPELPISESLREPFDSRFSMLCLNCSLSSPAVDGAGTSHQRPPLCASCGSRESRLTSTTTSVPMKRRSPSLASALQDPTAYSLPEPKKLFLDQEYSLAGFSKVDLPISLGPSASLPPHSLPPLRRTVSDPTGTFFDSFDSRPNVDQSPEITPPMSAKRHCTNSALPPLPLRRTISDPNPSPELISGSPTIAANASDLVEASPDSKRLRRIKERMKEMNQWWNEVMHEQEKPEEVEKICKDDNETKENGSEREVEETVGVERTGDSLELHFKCGCGKAFEVLLSGNSCYYKLL